MNLRRIARIALRDGRSLTAAPGGLTIIGIFWLLSGFFVVGRIALYRQTVLAMARAGGLEGSQMNLDVNDIVIRPYFLTLGMVLVFFVPLLTMRSVAEERRTGHLELLLSQPLRGAELLLGKYFGAMLSLFACLAVLVLQAPAIWILCRPDPGTVAAGFLGLLLLGACFLAVGILLSVISRSQVEAAVLSLGALLVLFLGPSSVSGDSGLSRFISLAARFEDFCRGLIDPGHVGFFLGVTLLFLTLALRCLDLVRWQG